MMIDEVPSNPVEPLSNGASAAGDLEERRRLWRVPAYLTMLSIAAVFAIYWQTSWSIVAIWIRSETFTHGFLILPISAYLIWQRRAELLWLTPKPNWWGILLLMALGLMWLVGHSTSVLVLEQLAMMAMVPTLIWIILGWKVTWSIAFPLAFLFFAVPMGEELVPYLMDFTANFTVEALRLTGIPVFHEGTFFEIPSGRWSVIEACSGIRYLIASLTLGCLYAYLTYHRLSRRLLFIALSLGVPIIANGMRAYIIVMIGHLSNMRLATGIDHLIYGWVFFGMIMLLLFWLGSFWREDAPEKTEAKKVTRISEISISGISSKQSAAASAIVLIVVAMWPAIGSHMNAGPNGPVSISLATPAPSDGWQLAGSSMTKWRPHYTGTDALVNQTYKDKNKEVNLYLAYYRRQRQGAELINSENVLVPQRDPVWRQTADLPFNIVIDGKHREVRLAKVRSQDQDLLVWYWYWVNGRTTTNHYLAKLWDAKAKLLGQTGDAAAIIISTPLTDNVGDAERLLNTFMDSMQGSIESSLDEAASE